MYENWSILKTELKEKQEEYSAVAQWCNDNQQYIIEDDGIYYKTSQIPEPTPEEVTERRIAELKQLLADSDYQAIKYAEGWITEEEYAPIKAQREAWREEIRQLTPDAEPEYEAMD